MILDQCTALLAKTDRVSFKADTECCDTVVIIYILLMPI